MSIYWSSLTKNITPYIAGEQPKDKDKFIKLNTNENPYPPSPNVIEAVKKAANDRLRLYPDPNCTEFREAAAEILGIKPQQVFAGNGSDEILAFSFAAFFESGAAVGKILFPDITYSFYPVYANLWNIPFATVPLNDDFSINTAGFLPSAGSPVGGVVLPNPNAPTGIALPLTDMLSLARQLGKQNKVFISDEAYIAFGAETTVPYINDYPNLLSVHTLSKGCSLAGLRFGYAAACEELIEGLCRIRDSFNSYPVDRLAQAGAVAAIKDKTYYDEINRRVVLTRERTAKELVSLGFIVLPSSANFLFIKAQNIAGDVFLSALRDRKILVRRFNKDRIKDYLRVSIGTDKDMDVFLDACKEILCEPSVR